MPDTCVGNATESGACNEADCGMCPNHDCWEIIDNQCALKASANCVSTECSTTTFSANVTTNVFNYGNSDQAAVADGSRLFYINSVETVECQINSNSDGSVLSFQIALGACNTLSNQMTDTDGSVIRFTATISSTRPSTHAMV